MRNHSLTYIALAVLVGFLFSGCGPQAETGGRAEEPASNAQATTSKAPDAAGGGHGAGEDGDLHGTAGAEPGSYEDWCGEHQVPESACTRCDPSLIPAFKAVGDWCAEHGLPESQCLACNPDLVIARPPNPEGD